MKSFLCFCGLLVTIGSASIASAAPAIEQEQILVDLSVGGSSIGGGSQEMLAQTFTASQTGCLTHLTLPIGCDASASLVVEVQEASAGVPSGIALTSEVLPGSLFRALPPGSPPGGFRLVEFSSPAFIESGRTYAIVLKSDAFGCGLFQGPFGDPYPAGHGYFDARPNPPGWIPLNSSGRDDLPFQVFIEVGTKEKCKRQH